MDRIRAFSLALTVALCTTTVALGQEKPSPRPVERVDPYEVSYDGFQEAYEDNQEPTILVLCGWGKSEHQAPDPGATLFNLDTSGLTFQLKSAFIEVLNDPQVDLDIVESNAQRHATARLSNVLNLRREREAIALLANELQAELVIVITLLDRDAGGTPNRLTFDAIDLARGRTITTFPFEWKLGTSTTDIKKYARVITKKFIEDYIARSQYSIRYTARIFGLPSSPRAIQDVRRAFETIQGVNRVRPRGASAVIDPNTGRSESATNFEIRYDDDVFSLAAELDYAIDHSQGMVSETLDMVGTTISLRVWHVESEGDDTPVAKECREVIMHQTEEGERWRRELKDLYVEKDSPSFAVLVNRSPTREEREAAGMPSSSVSGETVVIVQAAAAGAGNPANTAGGGSSGAAPRSTADESEVRHLTFLENQTNLIEEALYNRLGTNLLGFTRIDPLSARGRLAAKLDKERSVFQEYEIVEILRNEKIADIVIFGAGANFPDRDGYSATYTFRVVNLLDSQILATANASGLLAEGNMSEVVARMADDTIRDIACELHEHWGPPSKLDVTIKHAESDRDFQAISAAIEERRAESGKDKSCQVRIVGRPSVDLGTGEGVIKLALDYSCSFDELISELREISSRMPFRLNTLKINRSEAELEIIR